MNRTNSIHHIIDSRLSGIKLYDGFAGQITSQAYQAKAVKRPLAVAAAFCLCLMLAVPIMAATIPSFNRLLSLVSPEIAQMLQPVALVSESNGIKMEVVAAMNDDNTAVAYLTMQDLSGDRVDRSIDLYNYSISEGSMFTHEVIAYDEKTKTATIRLLANGGSRLNGKKVTVRIDSFLSDKKVFKEVPTGIDLANIQKTPQALTLDMDDVRGGGGNLYETWRTQGSLAVLKPEVLNAALPGVAFANISNAGIVDGRLHVQLHWTGNGIDDHGYVYLEDGAGKIIHPSNVSFGIDESGNAKYGREYEEDIFDIDPGQLAGFKLKGHFVTNGKYTEGKWETTFRIEAVKQSKQADCNMAVGNMTINRVSISPLGLTILGSGQPGGPAPDLDVAVTMKDGRKQDFSTKTSFNDDGRVIRKYQPSLPIDVENISQVSINGNVVTFNN